MICVILQPSYIPWRGYFDLIARADVFVFYDDVQYTRRDWRNRNRIKTPAGLQWLTIPVFNKGVQTQHLLIKDARICWDEPWSQNHWKSIQYSYNKAPFFDRYADALAQKYESHPEYLADFTIDLSLAISDCLGIHGTRFIRSSEVQGVSGSKTDRLISLIQAIGADHYISGPAAKDYIEEDKFEQAGIGLEYIKYQYPEYPQLYPPYDPQVSVLDLLFMVGPDTMKYIHPD